MRKIDRSWRWNDEVPVWLNGLPWYLSCVTDSIINKLTFENLTLFWLKNSQKIQSVYTLPIRSWSFWTPGCQREIVLDFQQGLNWYPRINLSTTLAFHSRSIWDISDQYKPPSFKGATSWQTWEKLSSRSSLPNDMLCVTSPSSHPLNIHVGPT